LGALAYVAIVPPFPGPVLPVGHSISKNMLQLIRLRPAAGVGLVHDRNASEVSESSTDERTGTTHAAPKLLLPFPQLKSPVMICKLQPAASGPPRQAIRLANVGTNQRISTCFKGFQNKSKQIKAEKLWRLIQLPPPSGPIRAMLTPLSRLFAVIRTYSHLFAVDF
jgi:hypothetical protein